MNKEISATKHSENVNMATKRLVYIDWMKAFGMYFIVLGHFFTWGAEYVYVFNVPLFFCMSGFLNKREVSHTLFLKKTFRSLVVPMLIIVSINFVVNQLANPEKFNSRVFLQLLIGPIIGDWYVLVTLWFVYTLIIIKTVFQFAKNVWQLYLWGGIFALLSFFNKQVGLVITPNAFFNIALAYPFFLFGTTVRKYRNFINSFNNKYLLIITLLVSLLIVKFCGRYNGYVGMYKCDYGENIFLFFVGGLAGTFSIYALSKLINYSSDVVRMISVGSIIILGFHTRFIWFSRQFYENSYVIDYLSSMLVLLIFIPIIKLAHSFFPALLGFRQI